MTSASKSGINFSYLMSGYDLMEAAGKHWMEAVRRYLPDSAEREVGDPVPGMEIIRKWQQWYLDPFINRDLRTPDMQLLSKVCLDQQKRCADLTIAWWKCSLKAMRAIGNGVQNGEQPSQIMQECMALSEEYVRSCAEFLAAGSDAITEQGRVFSKAPEEGHDKSKAAKPKGA